jgi:hypothetical protein
MIRRPVRRASLVILGILAGLVPHAASAVSTSVVISQVYGYGGGDPNGYQVDFIELHNRSSSTVDMDGWSVQFGVATDQPGTPFEGMTNLTNKTIAPGGYFLIQQGGGSSQGNALPTPDATGTFDVDFQKGKVALRTNQTPCMSGFCTGDAATLDFVGYGGANDSEGPQTAPSPGLDGTKADVRAAAGEQDTDDNHADFAVAAVNPRNSASTPVDKVAPVAAVNALPPFKTSTAFSVGWSASDPSGISQFESRRHVATPTAGFGSYASWYTGTSTSAVYHATAGQTVCASTRATDGASNEGPFSSEKCTAVPLDDAALTTTSFSRRTGAAYFGGTYSLSTTTGAKLKSATITAKRLALLATTCATCGSVQVRWRGASLGNFSLHSSTTTRKALILLTPFSSVQSGVLQIISLSSARVEIDGLGVSRK